MKMAKWDRLEGDYHQAQHSNAKAKSYDFWTEELKSETGELKFLLWKNHSGLSCIQD